MLERLMEYPWAVLAAGIDVLILALTLTWLVRHAKEFNENMAEVSRRNGDGTTTSGSEKGNK